jgi:hypothetical protein
LLDLYSVIREISFPDLGNGVFVYSSDVVVDGLSGNQPTVVRGALEGEIIIFASDGGGALIGQMIENGAVYKLSGGSLVRQEYVVGVNGVEKLSDGVWGFLLKIREELAAES